MERINWLETGNRVWTIRGYHQHGQLEGPKVDVPSNIGGTITWVEQRMCYLYVVKWDTGQITKHYSSELFPIGLFQNIKDLEIALKSGKNEEIIYTPSGSFKGFSISISYKENEYLFVVNKVNIYGWQNLSNCINSQEIKLEIGKLSCYKHLITNE